MSSDDELVRMAQEAPFICVPDWMNWLPITPRQTFVLGLVYTTQYEDGEFRMSLREAGEVLNIDRANLWRDLHKLTQLGFLKREPNGNSRPAKYLVDVVACMVEAHRNGFGDTGTDGETLGGE